MSAQRAARLAAIALACVCAAASAGVGAAPHPLGGTPRAAAERAAAPWRSPGKPSAPFTIGYQLSAAPAVGALLEIELEVRAPAEAADLGIDAQAADSQALLVASVAPVAGRAGGWRVTVLPLADGTSYLSVTAHGTIGGSVQSRSVAIPVRIGGDAKAAQAVQAGPAKDESTGEQVVLLPVVETSRRAPD